MTADERYMYRCLELAKRGAGLVSPNPMVGCVIVHNERIIAEGYHHRFGGPHAEVVAINYLQNKELLTNSTLYVNLEPCSHYGKTPPCSDLIIAMGLPRVVIGCLDPNPLVAGEGVTRLKSAGIDVATGILETESRYLNRAFFTYHTKQRPYILLKWAQTQDGFIDRERDPGATRGINWITNIKLKSLVHRWRAESDAILAGSGTVKNDNPELTTRDWPGKNPLRIILDGDGELTEQFRVFVGNVPTWLICPETPIREKENLRLLQTGVAGNYLPTLMSELYHHRILTLMVEGGRYTLESFIREGLWDEYRVFTGNKRFKAGVKAPEIPIPPTHTYQLNNELLQVGYNCKQR